jgi:O-antigen ligase
MIMLVALAILPILFSRHRFKILPIVLLALSLGWFFMPEQYQNRFRSIWNPTFGIQGGESSRQGRIKGFYNGLEIWQKYPLFGCGPGASRWAGSWDHETHNLPGQLAGELGTFGIITFLILLTCFGINHYNIWKNYKYLQEKKFDDEGLYYWRVSIAVMYGVFLLLFQGISLHNGYEYHWMWFAAFQALAAIFIQEKVTAAKQGKLLPSLPVKR